MTSESERLEAAQATIRRLIATIDGLVSEGEPHSRLCNRFHISNEKLNAARHVVANLRAAGTD